MRRLVAERVWVGSDGQQKSFGPCGEFLCACERVWNCDSIGCRSMVGIARNAGMAARLDCDWNTDSRMDLCASIYFWRARITTTRNHERLLVVAGASRGRRVVDCRECFTRNYVEHGIWRIRRAGISLASSQRMAGCWRDSPAGISSVFRHAKFCGGRISSLDERVK